jgi:hypothetical protein
MLEALMTIRFAVGSPGGPKSDSWKLWHHGDEAYLVNRGITAQHLKFSFHKSGNCRWARIEPGVSGKDRVILEWQRDEIAPVGGGSGARLLSMVFPTNHLSASKASEAQQIRLIEPAPQGHAVMIEIFLTNEREIEIRRVLSVSGQRQLLYCKILRNGLRLCATVSRFDCGPVDLSVPATPHVPGVVFGEVMFPDEDRHDTGRPVRLSLILNKELPPTVWELGGYEVDKQRL